MAAFVNPGRQVGTLGNFAQSARLGFAVGDPAFLNSAESRVAAYWRNLEHGTEIFKGRRIAGLWGNVGGPRGGLIGGALSPFGVGQGQKFVPFAGPFPEQLETSARNALRYLRKQNTSLGNTQRLHRALNLGATHGIIQNPIVAQDAYKRAFAEFRPADREREAVMRIFADWELKLRTRLPKGRPITGQAFRERTGFLTGGAISGFNYSLAVVGQNFSPLRQLSYQGDLVRVNRILARELAELVAQIQKEETRRPAVVTGALERATLSAKNRFPS